MPGTKPSADIQISHDLIDSLLKEFVPELAGETIEFVAAGWDNEIHRVGTDHAVRLPRRKEGAPLLEHEQRWLPELADALPLPIPSPIHSGRPAFGFPWHWSVVPWIEGIPFAHAPTPNSETFIDQLTSFLSALHKPAPAIAPVNLHRGGPLDERAQIVSDRLEVIAPLIYELGFSMTGVQQLWAEPVSYTHLTLPTTPYV